MKQKHTMRTFVYLTVGLAMLFYALPKIPYVTGSVPGLFTLSWLLFALLFIGANLYELIGADRETQTRRKNRLLLESRIHEARRGFKPQAVKGKHSNDKRRRFMS